ncbi:penicillin-insensitive murein endopeptidase [uncultured Vibrio sp.]|uniref:penicillin-insensitive murein endopeptidase n=1 Tax=uncultured Vibrio sp. TaxID=114054 RepID=UPI0009236E48|nr:penicillin-insensitive murein endopeptidase [uncultured Vibrio sp.]OIQ25712.1 MAG: penicillin-insensitive murein endopeptidase [Vibrio sp. MedPE-SWchi]
MMSVLSFTSMATPWEEKRLPSTLPTESIGSYANGCLAGAKALPLEGEGYQVIRSQRERYYAHPETVSFIQSLAKKTYQDLGSILLIGDLSLPQGGRFSSGHSSHQTGLDIDIWLRLTKQPLSEQELAKPKAMSVVHVNQFELNRKRWSEEHFQLVKLAAQQNQVARIFVHPVIKHQLCESELVDSRQWLRKVRPWWGHHSHIHVRLNCPQGDTSCQAQAAPPEGDGCGDELLSWWPKPEDKGEVAKPAKKKKPKIPPHQCLAMLNE